MPEATVRRYRESLKFFKDTKTPWSDRSHVRGYLSGVREALADLGLKIPEEKK